MRSVLVACLIVIFCCGCLCGGCFRQNHNYPDGVDFLRAEQTYRKQLVEPVIEALEKYRQSRGRYPDQLEQLVADGLLPAIPDLATNTDHLGKTGNLENAKPLQYSVVEDGFELRFSYGHFRLSLMAAENTQFLYVSAHKHWYQAAGYAPRRPLVAPSPPTIPSQPTAPTEPKLP